MEEDETRFAAENEVQTDRASGYLQQLCKHFAHKVPSTYDAAAGRIALPAGTSHLAAEARILRMRVEASTEPGLDAYKAILDDHLKRFASREELAWTWSYQSTGGRLIPSDTKR